MGTADPADLASRLDRVTYLLVALLVLQLIEIFDLGPAGLVLFVVFGLVVSAVYHTVPKPPSGRRR